MQGYILYNMHICNWCGNVESEKRRQRENGLVKVNSNFDKVNGLIQVFFFL